RGTPAAPRRVPATIGRPVGPWPAWAGGSQGGAGRRAVLVGEVTAAPASRSGGRSGTVAAACASLPRLALAGRRQRRHGRAAGDLGAARRTWERRLRRDRGQAGLTGPPSGSTPGWRRDHALRGCSGPPPSGCTPRRSARRTPPALGTAAGQSARA